MFLIVMVNLKMSYNLICNDLLFFICLKPLSPRQPYPSKTMDEEEQRKWKHTYKKMEAFLSTLPREKGWLSEHLFQFQGFWYHKRTLQGTIVAQQHLKARSSDIFLVTYPKSGTTWIKAIAFAIMNRTHYNHQTRPMMSSGPHECVPFLET